MGALRAIHRALRPNGRLLDIHPEPEHSWVEVHSAEQVIRVGQLDETDLIGRIHMARAVRAAAIAAGEFTDECHVHFAFVHHFDSGGAWLGYMAEHWSSARIDPSLIARTCAILEASGGAIRIPELVCATRLRRAT